MPAGKLSRHVGEGKGDVCRAAVRALRARWGGERRPLSYVKVLFKEN